jgi:IMP dehydrogenase/GMP reductase
MEYHYKDVFLLPKRSIVDSRTEIDTSIVFGNYKFKMPIVPANMKTVIDESLAEWLATNNYFYVMHRFGIDIVEFNKKMKNKGLISSISVGVNKDSYEVIDNISIEHQPDYITIDIAHGHCEKMRKMIDYIKHKFDTSFIIAGNVVTKEAVIDLQNWGADCIKVGIGPGCFISGTKVNTKNGIKNIEDIENGEYVLTHTGQYKKVIGKISRIEEDRLVTINGKITSTPQHEYYVIRKCDKEKVTEENLHDYAFWLEAEKLSNDYFLIQYK